MAKQIIYGEEARRALQAGIDATENASDKNTLQGKLDSALAAK